MVRQLNKVSSSWDRARGGEWHESDQLITSQIDINKLYVTSITEMEMWELGMKSNKIFTEININWKDKTINYVNDFVIKKCREWKPLKKTLKDAIIILENHDKIKYYTQIDLIIHLIRLLNRAEREKDIVFEYQMKEILKDWLLV